MNFQLPPLPNTLAEILQILKGTPAADQKRLVTVIEKDPAIALYVLRQVNSAYYGLRRQVTQIQRAVTLLGPKRVCNLVLAIALKKSFPSMQNPTTRIVYEHIVKTSIATAAFARDLAFHLRLQVSETAFTGGLLHQMGRLVFLYNVPQQYVRIWPGAKVTWPRIPVTAPSLEKEHALFNTDYLKLGTIALRKWDLPDELAGITNRLRTLDNVVEPPLRILPLIVAIGRSASEDLFEPDGTGSYAEHEANGRLMLLDKLAQARHTDVERLNAFLEEKREVVQHFARSVVSAR
ncbi:MAG: HDOD domain-containing protein [Rhodothermales bacterium]